MDSPAKHLNWTIFVYFPQRMHPSMTRVSTVVEPCSTLLSFPLMFSAVPSSQPMTYHVFVTMLRMMLCGKIPHGLVTGRKTSGFSQSIGQVIGWYAPLTLLSNDCSSLTALLSRSPGRRTFGYDDNLFFWEAAKVQLGHPTTYQPLFMYCFRESYGPCKSPGRVDCTPSYCKLHTLCWSVLALSYVYTKTEPIQSNGHDCGLWVLVQMMAILRGFDVTGLHENNMSMFCYYLRDLISRIPASGH